MKLFRIEDDRYVQTGRDSLDDIVDRDGILIKEDTHFYSAEEALNAIRLNLLNRIECIRESYDDEIRSLSVRIRNLEEQLY